MMKKYNYKIYNSIQHIDKIVYNLFAQIHVWLILARVDERFQGCTDFIVRICEWSGRMI